MRLDLSCRSNGQLLREFTALGEKARSSTAELLAYVGEIDARRLYREASFPSMFQYCVRRMHMSEDVAYKRIQVARKAREVPDLLDAIADGRLHVTAAVRLIPHLFAPNAAELIGAASHGTKHELELLLAERFPQPDLPTVLEPVTAGTRPFRPPTSATAIGPGGSEASAPGDGIPGELVPEPVCFTTCGHSASMPSASPLMSDPSKLEVTEAAPFTGTRPLTPGAPASQARLAPLVPQRFALRVTLAQATHDKPRRAQDLLGHRVTTGDLAGVLDLALEALIRQLERSRFAAAEKPRPAKQRHTAGKRHVPAHVRRAVWERDRGRCTFVSDTGHRCEERRGLEYEHVVPFARGGEATESGLRLRCRPHNQLLAEQVYGAGFMARKRKAPRRRAAKTLPSRTNELVR